MSQYTDEIRQKLLKAAKEQSNAEHQTALTNEVVEDSKTDRSLKSMYAKSFIAILALQLIVMNLIFVLSGTEVLAFEEWELELYMGGTMAQVFGVVLVITKNLFPTKK